MEDKYLLLIFVILPIALNLLVVLLRRLGLEGAAKFFEGAGPLIVTRMRAAFRKPTPFTAADLEAAWRRGMSAAEGNGELPKPPDGGTLQ